MPEIVTEEKTITYVFPVDCNFYEDYSTLWKFKKGVQELPAHLVGQPALKNCGAYPYGQEKIAEKQKTLGELEDQISAARYELAQLQAAVTALKTAAAAPEPAATVAPPANGGNGKGKR